MTVWRLQTNTDSKTGYKIADYCIENNVLAMGWSLKDGHLEWLSDDLFLQALTDRSNIESFQDYSDFLKKYNVYGGSVNSNVSRFFHEVKENDTILQSKSKYRSINLLVIQMLTVNCKSRRFYI